MNDDLVEVYLREVRATQPMSREKELECIRHVRARDDQAEWAGKDLVEANLELVVMIARRRASDRVHILDLIQAGNQALLAAVRAFADSEADNFTNYATPFIEDAIAHAVTTPSC